ncbi:MAG: hypothetical protein II839_05745 [Kiritimatiellae bacterium]|nr:hypothetical protein [Kiritimatiellia bacterium]
MRLSGFDYSRPMFYMVTLKRLPGRQALSAIVEPGRCEMNPTTRAFVNCIRTFHMGCAAIEPIECFTVMPDHVHLLIKIRDQLGAQLVGDPAAGGAGRAAGGAAPTRPAPTILRLETIVSLLVQALEGRYAETTGLREQVFDARWHDWIVAARGQLAAFTRYIRENPKRAWLRQANRQFFTRVGRLSLGGREWFAYGNPALLELPVVEPFQCSRKWPKGGSEWTAALARAERTGPGGAGIGTFMSPCEKECGNAIFKAGGSLVVLSPEGFAERWHPARNKEALCAEGRMLFLSLYEAQAAKLDHAALYRRCHEMGDLAVAALGR